MKRLSVDLPLTEVCFGLQIFGLEALLGSAKLWPLLLALTVAPAVVQCILLPFCPESPRFLLINLKQEQQARKGICSTAAPWRGPGEESPSQPDGCGSCLSLRL